MNTNNDIAFVLDTDIPEETLIGLAAAVDQLDDLHMVIGGIVTAPEQNRTLEEYVERATRYLTHLLDRIREDDLRHVSTAPLEESMTRQRIARVLRAGARA